MPESHLLHLDHRILVTVTQILTTWQVEPRLQAALLGWTTSDLQDVLAGTAPTPQSAAQLERVMLTVEFVRALHGRYGNAERWWLHRPNPAAPFNDRTPLEYLASGDLVALQATVQHLDDALRGKVPPSAQAVAQAATLPQPDIDLET